MYPDICKCLCWTIQIQSNVYCAAEVKAMSEWFSLWLCHWNYYVNTLLKKGSGGCAYTHNTRKGVNFFSYKNYMLICVIWSNEEIKTAQSLPKSPSIKIYFTFFSIIRRGSLLFHLKWSRYCPPQHALAFVGVKGRAFVCLTFTSARFQVRVARLTLPIEGRIEGIHPAGWLPKPVMNQIKIRCNMLINID